MHLGVARHSLMKVLYVNGKFLAQPITGVQRFAMEVVKAWDNALESGYIDRTRYRIRILAPRTHLSLPQYRHLEIVGSRLSGKIWEQLYLPYRTAGQLLFSPYATAPIFKRRHIVTIHDAGVAATPGQYSFAFRTYNKLVYWALGIAAEKVITVSEFSKNELHRYFAIPLEKMQVARQGYEQILSVQPDSGILTKNGLRSKEFVLAVSSRSPIKNFDTLAAAWKLMKRPDMKLAVAGGYNRRIFGKEVEHNYGDGVTFLGYVSDAELRCLYENAACFVYPSSYEGFGLPPLEAMACGCPVIVSDTSALPETCGYGALYCNPLDVQDIALKIATLLDDPELSMELRAKGKQRIQEFSYRSCAEAIWLTVSQHI